MAVDTVYAPVEQAGNGILTAFNFSFKIFAETDLVVQRRSVIGTANSPLVLNTDYTVSFDSTAENGTVTYTVAPISAGSSYISRDSSRLQGTVFPREGTLPAKTTETALDKLTMRMQEVSAIVAALVITPTSIPIVVGTYAQVDALATTSAFIAKVTDTRSIKMFLGDRTQGENGWATLGGY